MVEAHGVIVRAFQGTPAKLGIDLGCGDGTLLNTLRMSGLIADGLGIEADEGRVERGQRRYPDLTLLHKTIQEWAKDWGKVVGDETVILFMPGRLEEMTRGDASMILSMLRRAPRVILYCYERPLLGERAKLIGAKIQRSFERNGYESAPVARWEDPPPCKTLTCQGTVCETPGYLLHHHDSAGEPPHGPADFLPASEGT
jgi:hypothetical protein